MQKWSATLTPYVVEPLDNTGPDSPVNKQVIRKSAQTGFTVMAIAVVGSRSIPIRPAASCWCNQRNGALADFIADKLNPAIEASAGAQGQGEAASLALGRGLDNGT
jgi:phage terminase large subunit GpA-like protein